MSDKLVEPIVAFRGWLRSGDRLTSSGGRIEWKPSEPLVASHINYLYVSQSNQQWSFDNSCESPCEAWDPNNGYGCGIYGLKTKELLLDYLYPFYNSDHMVLGEVYLWGKLYEHEMGYRAQFAYPKKLFYARNKYVAETYNIPFEPDEVICTLVRKLESYTYIPRSHLNRYVSHSNQPQTTQILPPLLWLSRNRPKNQP
jgi:hypothetical protein